MRPQRHPVPAWSRLDSPPQFEQWTAFDPDPPVGFDATTPVPKHRTKDEVVDNIGRDTYIESLRIVRL